MNQTTITRPEHTPTVWTRADALKVPTDDPTTTMPRISSNFPLISDKVFVWDTMPLRGLDNKILSVNGWNIIFTLTAIREPEHFIGKDGRYSIQDDWEDRHGRARICFWFSKDAKTWQYGGRVMQEGVSPTSREWAGTPILLDNEGNLDLYYTCVTPGATIAKVRGKVVTTENGVYMQGFDKVKPLFEADGVYYQTEAQNPYFNFRDPSPFIDPADGKLYMLFEGNVAGNRGSHIVGKEECGILPPGHDELGGARFQTGCVGIAVADDLNGDNWTLLPPLITAVGVNDQTERPHLIIQDGKYYLFTISHKFTYAYGLSGPDGLYGFVADSLFGDYEPLNGSGLVLGNPSDQPYQSYSHCIMANGLVTSFIDSIPVTVPNSEKLVYRIGGTEAPTVRVKLKGNRTYLSNETFDYGYIPAMENVTIMPKGVNHHHTLPHKHISFSTPRKAHEHIKGTSKNKAIKRGRPR